MTDVNYWLHLNQNSETGGITPQLSRQINLLGTLLGEAIAENTSAKMLALVEKLRSYSKQAEKTHDIQLLQEIATILQKLPLDDINWLLRTYTLFFTLINEAEIQEMIRINHERSLNASLEQPRKQSIMAAVKFLKEQSYSYQDAVTLVSKLDIRFTLTAHPTEARRQTVLQKQREVGQLLNQLNQPSDLQQQTNIIEQLRQHIIILLYTDNIRSSNLTVADEVRNGLYFLRTTIWKTVPKIYHDLQFAFQQYYQKELPELTALIRYHTWIGGDCDGNPFVTPTVMQQTLQRHLKAALKTYRPALEVLRDELSLSDKKIKISAGLQKSLANDAKQISLDMSKTKHFLHEPYRLKVSYIITKIDAKLAVLKDSATPKQHKMAKQYQVTDLQDDLLLIQASLIKSELPYLAKSILLTNLLIQVKTFGFHMAALDIRQHSATHRAALTEIFHKTKLCVNYEAQDESAKMEILTNLLTTSKKIAVNKVHLSKKTQQVLDVFKVMREAAAKSIGSYIISMTHHLSDVLAVLALAKIGGLKHIDIVPLFETIGDLAHIQELLTVMYSNEVYQKQLASRGNFQEVLLGYSDSNKDGGYWMANYLLHQAQHTIGKISREYKIDFRIFHGRGGSAGRGGGRVHNALLVMPKESQNGRMRVTEQGEVISFHYGLNAMTERHYEQTFYAMILANTKPCATNHATQAILSRSQTDLLQQIAEHSYKNYRDLIQHPDFWAWYIHVTPIEFISKLPIASRPVMRKAANEVDFENLRAIPWVFSWTQTRYNVPGWFGVGQALGVCILKEQNALSELKMLYKQSPFFQWLIDNIQQEMAKTHLQIAEFYQQFHPEVVINQLLLNDFQLAQKYLLLITGEALLLNNNRVLQKSIELRNPYTDVLNLLQVELMRRWYRKNANKEALNAALLLSINGIAGAVQSTG
ncbi:MAG: phosphoenolpyruvate carboxylase [Gammaproteobacteria bacterium]|nr:phosphoenolpyruvate carboxylase [Gammaproteobacteria bacterium]